MPAKILSRSMIQFFLASAAVGLMTFGALFPASAVAQNIVVLVNDEPITTYDVAQRQRWMARTSGFGDKMKAALQSDKIKDRYRELMMAANPSTREEAEVVAERVKKQLVVETKQRVLSQSSGASRKAAIDDLIEDRLKIQAARKISIAITDAEVTQALSARAKGPDGKVNLEGFYAQFESDGINRKTVQEVIRAQLAWRDVIRRSYGAHIQSAIGSGLKTESDAGDGDTVFDAREVRLALSSASDQKAIAKRLMEAENLRERFRSCGDLPKQVKLLSSSTVKSLSKAKLSDFPKEMQPLVSKAGNGQMTPPLVSGSNVLAYAVCRKTVVAKNDDDQEDVSDLRQKEFERYSRRHLQDIKQSASIDYRGS